jgi:hypothetical protein
LGYDSIWKIGSIQFKKTLDSIVAIETTIFELKKKIFMLGNYAWFREILHM